MDSGFPVPPGAAGWARGYMNICMIVFNSVTKDARVLREARSLQAAGHSVSLIGIPDEDATSPVEYLDDGIRVFRVLWQARAYRKLLVTSIFRTLPMLALVGLVAYGFYRFAGWLFASDGPLVRLGGLALESLQRIAALTPLQLGYAVLLTILAAAIVFVLWRVARAYGGVLLTSLEMQASEDDTLRRYAAIVFRETPLKGEFPSIRSRIPAWVPDFILEIFLEPIGWFGAKTGRFSLYRYRGEEAAALAIKLRPDAIHCHDCAALSPGYIVKRKLNIPLVYDAHEIYEAAATRAFGVRDYYIRVHQKYLPQVDGFITINESAALYYRYAYPTAPPAVVIRNATDLAPPAPYDGRLHRAAGLPKEARILLYQGGFTADRGLPTLVRAGSLLPKHWYLVMMGWGPLAGELKQIASAAAGRTRAIAGSSEDKVRFVPAAPARELLDWTQGATVGIIPYENKMLNHWISTPNKLWEYANAGVPLIVQPFPEMRRIVENYHCGWVLPRDLTPAAIADLVGALSDEAIASAREGCRSFIRKDSWSTSYERRLLDLYEKLAAPVSTGQRQPIALSQASAVT